MQYCRYIHKWGFCILQRTRTLLVKIITLVILISLVSMPALAIPREQAKDEIGSEFELHIRLLQTRLSSAELNDVILHYFVTAHTGDVPFTGNGFETGTQLTYLYGKMNLPIDPADLE